MFVQDAAALAAYDALVSVQLTGSAFAGCDWSRAATQGARAALITADCDHFASIASWRRVAHGKPWLDMQSFAVTNRCPNWWPRSTTYRPAFVASYPTVLALLADEQHAGRLQLRPAGLWSGGEVLSRATHTAIEAAFDCPLLNEYGASECLTIGLGCREGALHVNADWVILEPVDRAAPADPARRAVAHGAADQSRQLRPADHPLRPRRPRARARRAPCACGSPLPAIESKAAATTW